MINRFLNFMHGRYGVDSFGIFLVIFSCFVNLILSIFRVKNTIPYVGLIPMLILFYAAFRMLSKNINRRAGENRLYMKWQNKFKKMAESIRVKVKKYKQKKADVAHRYYKCKKCKQEIRVPAGKGKIRITCPKCGIKFQKKT